MIITTLVWGIEHPHKGTFGAKMAEKVIDVLKEVAHSMKIEWEDITCDMQGDREIRLHSLVFMGLNAMHEEYAWYEEAVVLRYYHSGKKIQVAESYLNFDSELSYGEEPQLSFENSSNWLTEEFCSMAGDQEHQLLVNGFCGLGHSIQ